MKNVFFGTLIFFCVTAFGFASGIFEEARRGNERAQMSYAFGMALAADIFAGSGLEFNYDAFIRGFRNVMENNETRYTMEEAMEIIQATFAAMDTAMRERNSAEGQAFLAENAQRPGVVTTPSGLQFESIVEGSGEMPDISDVVLVHYHGTTIDGTVFDSSMERGEPVEIPLEWVIPGWSEGLRMMREGGRAILFIPPHLAYGSQGAGDLIEPYATIIFEVELIEIMRTE